MLCLGKLCAITVCGVPDFLKKPQPNEYGPLALIHLGKKTDIHIPDGNGEDIYKFLIK
jgi:hypothetical protein